MQDKPEKYEAYKKYTYQNSKNASELITFTENELRKITGYPYMYENITYQGKTWILYGWIKYV